jgi:hypothetical protein
VRRQQGAPPPRQLHRLFWAWWEQGGGRAAKAAWAEVRRKREPEPAAFCEPERHTWDGARWQTTTG